MTAQARRLPPLPLASSDSLAGHPQYLKTAPEMLPTTIVQADELRGEIEFSLGKQYGVVEIIPRPEGAPLQEQQAIFELRRNRVPRILLMHQYEWHTNGLLISVEEAVVAFTYYKPRPIEMKSLARHGAVVQIHLMAEKLPVGALFWHCQGYARIFHQGLHKWISVQAADGQILEFTEHDFSVYKADGTYSDKPYYIAQLQNGNQMLPHVGVVGWTQGTGTTISHLCEISLHIRPENRRPANQALVFRAARGWATRGQGQITFAEGAEGEHIRDTTSLETYTPDQVMAFNCTPGHRPIDLSRNTSQGIAHRKAWVMDEPVEAIRTMWCESKQQVPVGKVIIQRMDFDHPSIDNLVQEQLYARHTIQWEAIVYIPSAQRIVPIFLRVGHFGRATILDRVDMPKMPTPEEWPDRLRQDADQKSPSWAAYILAPHAPRDGRQMLHSSGLTITPAQLLGAKKILPLFVQCGQLVRAGNAHHYKETIPCLAVRDKTDRGTWYALCFVDAMQRRLQVFVPNVPHATERQHGVHVTADISHSHLIGEHVTCSRAVWEWLLHNDSGLASARFIAAIYPPSPTTTPDYWIDFVMTGESI